MSVRTVLSGDVTVVVEGPVVTVTFARPAKRNALTQAMYGVVADTLEAADADTAIAAVVITGAGDAFTAGNDVSDLSPEANLDEVSRFLTTIASITVPLIAAVNGMAVGVGLTMLLHCDLVYVEPGAVLSAPFVGLGLVPEAGSTLLLPLAIGERRASELLLMGRRIDGSQAAEWGLANAAVSPALDAALQAARRLADQPRLAVRSTKALVRSEERSLRGRMAEERRRFVDALAGAEFAEMIAALAKGVARHA